jgi:hypothetical protein
MGPISKMTLEFETGEVATFSGEEYDMFISCMAREKTRNVEFDADVQLFMHHLQEKSLIHIIKYLVDFMAKYRGIDKLEMLEVLILILALASDDTHYIAEIDLIPSNK